MDSITREEGTYSFINGHFAIDCSCGNLDIEARVGDEYTNRMYRMASTGREIITKHTFYARDMIINSLLESHQEEEGDEPLSIICRNCERDFALTYESSREIAREIHAQ